MPRLMPSGPSPQVRAAVILDDEAAGAAPGQMRRAEFLAALEHAVFAAAEPGLSRAGRTARDCPFIRYWFDFYRARDTEQLRRAVSRHAPETKWAASAEEYVSILSERTRRSADVWASTGRIEWRLTDASAAGDPRVIVAELGPGAPLDAGLRAKAETVLQEDFSGVRIHTGDHASSMARRFEARAFTIGRDIAFAEGEYRPGTPVGDAIIAHELAHVVQQKAGRAQPEPPAEGAALERDADRSAAGAVMSIWTAGRSAALRVKPALKTGLRLQRCGSGKSPQRPVAGGPLSFASSDFEAEADGPVTITFRTGGVKIESTEVFSKAAVTATGGTNVEAAGWKAGYVQTVFSSHRKAEYVDSAGAHNNQLEVKLPGPTRDGSRSLAPWYSSKREPTAGDPAPKSSGVIASFRSTNSTVFTYMSDTPGMPFVPDKTPDGAGTLTGFSGEDRFGAWLIARQEASPNEIRFLNRFEWMVDWTSTVTAGGSSNGTKLLDKGRGKGSKEPVLVGPVACEAAVTQFEKGGVVAADKNKCN
jgi:hypothetical protein